MTRCTTSWRLAALLASLLLVSCATNATDGSGAGAEDTLVAPDANEADGTSEDRDAGEAEETGDDGGNIDAAEDPSPDTDTPFDAHEDDAARDAVDDAMADDDVRDADPDDTVDLCGPDVEANVCGGCEDLGAFVGQPCACGSGTWQCDGRNAIVCANDAGERMWRDMDGDGYGDSGPLPSEFLCPPGASGSPILGDCDDDDPAMYPGVYRDSCRSQRSGRYLCVGASYILEPCEVGRCEDRDGVAECVVNCVPDSEVMCERDDPTEPWVRTACDAYGYSRIVLDTCPAGGGCEDGVCMAEACYDGVDNDDNGSIDCDDDACAASRYCAPIAPDTCAAVVTREGGPHRVVIRCADGARIVLDRELASSMPEYPEWIRGTNELLLVTSIDGAFERVLRVLDLTTATYVDIDPDELRCRAPAWPSVDPETEGLLFECPHDEQVLAMRWPSLSLRAETPDMTRPEFTRSIYGMVLALGWPEPPIGYASIWLWHLRGAARPDVPISEFDVRPLPGFHDIHFDPTTFPLQAGDLVLDVVPDAFPNVILVSRELAPGDRRLAFVARNGDTALIDEAGPFSDAATLIRVDPSLLSEELSR